MTISRSHCFRAERLHKQIPQFGMIRELVFLFLGMCRANYLRSFSVPVGFNDGWLSVPEADAESLQLLPDHALENVSLSSMCMHVVQCQN
jgi:hypothetical protein